jgi:hypothetical protein
VILERHQAPNVEAAASKLAAIAKDREFDIFRGQIDSTWRLRPSAMRVEEDAYREAVDRIVLFTHFCRRILFSLGITIDGMTFWP